MFMNFSMFVAVIRKNLLGITENLRKKLLLRLMETPFLEEKYTLEDVIFIT